MCSEAKSKNRREHPTDLAVGGIGLFTQSLPWVGFGLFGQSPCVGGDTTEKLKTQTAMSLHAAPWGLYQALRVSLH